MKLRGLLLLGVILVAVPQDVGAGGLASHSEELAVDATHTDVEGEEGDLGGEEALVSLAWHHALRGGFLQVGLRAAYESISPDDLPSVSSLAVGPAALVNFTPEKTLCPFLSASVSTIEGDAGDVYDVGYRLSAGLRAFVGDSASVNVAAFGARLDGPDDEQDIAGISVGVSFFFGRPASSP